MKIGKKKIVLITTGQPATNPRIVKEAEAFYVAGHEVILLYCFVIDWAEKEDRHLLKHVSWKHKLIGGSPTKDKQNFNLTRVRQKSASVLCKLTGNKGLIAERTQARCYDELLKAAVAEKADWYIGHNLGALAVCVNAALANHAKAGFDFEDYHRGEQKSIADHELKRIIYLEKKYIPKLQYLTTASPLISVTVMGNFPKLHVPVFTILNAFDLKDQPEFRDAHGKTQLKLFWFSQTIGRGRGIELILNALKTINDPDISLTLAGRMDVGFKQVIEDVQQHTKSKIKLHGIIAPDELAKFSSQFDIGLALEPASSENNNIALSNKIFTYLLAGNAIIFTGTSMQERFNSEFQCGKLVSIGNVNEMISAILFYKEQKILAGQRKYNYQLARKRLNWQMESEKLLSYFNHQCIKHNG